MQKTFDFTETVNVLEISGALNIDLLIDKVSGSTSKITIEGDSNILYNYLEVEKNAEKLVLHPKKHASIKQSKTYRVRLQTADFEGIYQSGATVVNLLTPLKNDKFLLEMSGASKFKTVDIQVNKLKINASGASIIDISGTAENAKYELSGASKLSVKDLISKEIEIDASGASKIECNPIESLSGNVSGASKITYLTEPHIKSLSVSGASKISKE